MLHSFARARVGVAGSRSVRSVRKGGMMETDATAPGSTLTAVIDRRTVLIIDDEPDIRYLARRVVGRLGFTVVTADNGHEGLEQLRTHINAIRCILLDLNMPDLDGEEAFHKIRDIAPDMPIIVMSGYHEEELRRRFADQEHVRFLPKPFSLLELQLVVHQECT
jgi:two-component system, cell cycle sensor histidine kinase and response regulator CckA